jgi:hypothetical protein
LLQLIKRFKNEKAILTYLSFAFMTVNIFSQAIPKLINCQAVLKDASGNILAGDFAMTIKIYDGPKDGTLLWSYFRFRLTK